MRGRQERRNIPTRANPRRHREYSNHMRVFICRRTLRQKTHTHTHTYTHTGEPPPPLPFCPRMFSANQTARLLCLYRHVPKCNRISPRIVVLFFCFRFVSYGTSREYSPFFCRVFFFSAFSSFINLSPMVHTSRVYSPYFFFSAFSLSVRSIRVIFSPPSLVSSYVHLVPCHVLPPSFSSSV